MRNAGRQKKPSKGSAAQRSSSGGDHLVTFSVSIFLVAIVWMVFGQTLQHEFVNYDDSSYIYENPIITKGLSAGGIGWAFANVHSGNWHPLTTISHMLDCQLYGLQPWGHHLTNVLLHAAAAILLFIALRELTDTLWPSAFVAVVFAIHPLRVESVAWVAERKDVLSGVFFTLTLWAYARYVRGRRPSPGRFTLVLVFFALGLMCKPTLVTVPFVLLLLDYWPLRRVAGSSANRGATVTESIQELLVEKIPFFVLSAASCVATLMAQKETIMGIRQLTFGDRIGNAMISYIAYIGQMIWPIGLAVFYPFPANGINVLQASLAFLILVVVSVCFCIWRGKYPFLLTGWFWFLGMLIPMIGIVQVGAQTRADRYTYLAQIGLYILVTWGAIDLLARRRGGREVLIALAVVVVGGLAVGSHIQTASWKNSETLWTQALANTSSNYIAHTNLGDALMKKGRLDEAVLQCRKALEINPDCAEAHTTLGYALSAKGNWQDAILSYRAAMRGRPNYAINHNNLAVSLASVGETEEAIAEFNEALRIDAEYQDAHSNLASVLIRVGRRDEALAHLREALRLKPDDEKISAQLRQLGAGK